MKPLACHQQDPAKSDAFYALWGGVPLSLHFMAANIKIYLSLDNKIPDPMISRMAAQLSEELDFPSAVCPRGTRLR